MTGISDDCVSDVVGEQLREAAAAYDDTPKAEALLWQAQSMAPECLPVYFALYKFYFYKRRLADAERAALLGLQTAAGQGGFPADWTTLTPNSAPWWLSHGPSHFYLFTLKALAFIRLRLGKQAESFSLLSKLRELDPSDSVGSSVIRDLASGLAKTEFMPSTAFARQL